MNRLLGAAAEVPQKRNCDAKLEALPGLKKQVGDATSSGPETSTSITRRRRPQPRLPKLNAETVFAPHPLIRLGAIGNAATIMPEQP